MAREQNFETFVPTVFVQHPRLGRMRMNVAAYDAQTCSAIVEGPTTPPIKPSAHDPPLKGPRFDAKGRRIANLHSPMLRA
jgi:hypothetical protein